MELLLHSPATPGGTRCCQARASLLPWTRVQQRGDGRGVYCRARAEQRVSWESYSDLNSHLIFSQHNFPCRLQLSGASHFQRRSWTLLPAPWGLRVPMPGTSICPWCRLDNSQRQEPPSADQQCGITCRTGEDFSLLKGQAKAENRSGEGLMKCCLWAPPGLCLAAGAGK